MPYRMASICSSICWRRLATSLWFIVRWFLHLVVPLKVCCCAVVSYDAGFIFYVQEFFLIPVFCMSFVTIQVSVLLCRLRRGGWRRKAGAPRAPPRGLAGPLEPPAK